MPTYVCWTRPGQLSQEQLQDIATALTNAHHEIALAPRYFVQVIFQSIDQGSHFIAGAPAAHNQIWVRADIRAGRTPEQKQNLMFRICRELGEITGTPKENIWVYISDIPGPSVLEFGHLLPNPGEEESWFQKFPTDLHDELRTKA